MENLGRVHGQLLEARERGGADCLGGTSLGLIPDKTLVEQIDMTFQKSK